MSVTKSGRQFTWVDANITKVIKDTESGGQDITQLENDVAALQIAVAPVPQLVTDVSTLQADVAPVPQLVTDVATLQADVAPIPQLVSDVSTLQSDVAPVPQLVTDVSALQTAVAPVPQLVTDVGTLQGQVSTLQSDVAPVPQLVTDVSTLQTAVLPIPQLVTDVGTLQTDVAAVEAIINPVAGAAGGIQNVTFRGNAVDVWDAPSGTQASLYPVPGALAPNYTALPGGSGGLNVLAGPGEGMIFPPGKYLINIRMVSTAIFPIEDYGTYVFVPFIGGVQDPSVPSFQMLFGNGNPQGNPREDKLFFGDSVTYVYHSTSTVTIFVGLTMAVPTTAIPHPDIELKVVQLL